MVRGKRHQVRSVEKSGRRVTLRVEDWAGFRLSL